MKSSLRAMGTVILSILLALSLTGCACDNTSNEGPTAAFSADVRSCCAPLSVIFTDESIAGGNNITSWYWDFGDGNSSIDRNPSHTYDAGTYNVTLTVTDSHNCSDTKTEENYITANQGPTAAFSFIVTDCCVPLFVVFNDESIAGGNNITSWYWDFGDGNSSTDQNPSHTYDTGTYNVALTVTDSHNCSDTKTEENYIGGNISMITPYPYMNETDYSCRQPFSSIESSPWGLAHNGIDFWATGDLKPFQAACSGVVDRVELWQNPLNLCWQVNVMIKFNYIYVVDYAFEPATTVQSDGQTQLDSILVSEGETVSQGDIIGYLYNANADSHVHFGLCSLYNNWDAICPEPYFTPEARDSILRLIHEYNEGWDMCY